MITDRDIAVRAVAEGLGPETKIWDVMSQEVKYCFDDEDLNVAAEYMSDIKLRRLPVLNQDKRLIGILSVSDLPLGGAPRQIGSVISGIPAPGGAHCQAVQ